MSIRFKFRSSISFDSIDLRGRKSISVRDLRAEIVAQKKLQIGRDFDLVISDADTGTALEDENFHVKEGASIIIKRVPADLSGAGIVERIRGGYEERVLLPPPPFNNVDMENFDDFGGDLYPAIDESLPKLHDVRRYSETSPSRHQNIVSSDLSEAMSKEVVGDNCCNEHPTVEVKQDIKSNMHTKFSGYDQTSSPELNMDLPTELRCPLCNAIFKEAVLIPCCQHSFCDRCVRLKLIETGRCPRCSSMKCNIDNLLPNLSLRQAIEHFREARAANNDYNNIPHYVPDITDVESGIRGKEVSCAVSVRQREQACPHSPSATGKGSNQVVEESAYGGKLNSYINPRLIHQESDKLGKSTMLPNVIKEMKGEANRSSQAVKHMTAPQQIIFPSTLHQNVLQVEGGFETLLQPSRYRKAGRNCYLCGSPDHLIRECPEASNAYSVNPTGDATFYGSMPAYPQAYWNGAPYAHAGPYGSMFGYGGMMPFDQTMGPVSSFGFSPYMPSMYPGMPTPYGFMRLWGGQHPMMTAAKQPFTNEKLMDTRTGDRNRNTLAGHPERFREHGLTERYQVDEEDSGSFSEDDNHIIHRKHHHNKCYGSSHQQQIAHEDERIQTYERRLEKSLHPSISGRDQRPHHSGKSNSEARYSSDSSSRHNRERKKSHHEHRSRRETSTDHRNHSHRHHRHNHHHTDFGLEEDSSSGERHQYEKGAKRLRSSKQVLESKDERLYPDRWDTHGFDDDYKGDHNSHKRKRTR